MHFSTTDGGEWDVPDMCLYCEMDTTGNHQSHCPLHQPLNKKESYAEFGLRLKASIKRHPEWGCELI